MSKRIRERFSYDFMAFLGGLALLLVALAVLIPLADIVYTFWKNYG